MAARGRSTPEEVFADSEAGLAVHRRLVAILGDLDLEVRATRSQVTFLRRYAFAHVWSPSRPDACTVLSLTLPQPVTSSRFATVTPSARGWTHHLELGGPADVDDEVAAWVRIAYHAAG